jgi:periplasmic divalent cation tolerance protein
MESHYVLVMTTLPAEADAPAFAHTLVEKRLAACVNVLPLMDSIYRWEGRVASDGERQLIMKTSRTCLAGLWEQVRKLHPYEMPEFIVLPIVDGNAAYLSWVGESTRTTE